VYFEGAVLIEDTWNPEFEACRAFVAAASPAASRPGVPARPIPTWSCPTGPIIVPWEPFPERLRPNTVSHDGQIALAAEICRRRGNGPV